MKKYIGIFLSLSALISVPAMAAISPIGLSIIAPVQFPTEDVGITGIRANLLWGRHRDVFGLDVGGIGNTTTLNFSGLVQAAGVFNYNVGSSNVLGIQAAGITNINVNKSHIYGVQVALGINNNSAESTLVGLQAAAIANYSPFTKVVGVQVGLYNKARTVYGLQIGLINVTENLHGFQIGLVNVFKNGLFALSPMVNFGF